ncbi:DMT family transporter [Amylibacter sp.]|nr:DMT family transporter [Amylibacter sp.]
MPENNQETENWRGILWAMLSVLGASAMAVSVRGASLGLDTKLIVGYRLFFTLIFIGLLILIVPRLRSEIRFNQPRAHLVRGTLMAFSIHLGFYTLSIVPLAAAAILFATAPIFATIISVLLGRETIGFRRTLAILVGFIGTIIVMRPSSEIIDTNMIYGIGSSIFFGFSLVMSRNLARTDGPLSTLISTSVIGLVITLPLAAPVFEVTTDITIILWTLILILFGILRQYSDIQAYRYAQAAVIAPISYIRVVLIGLMAYLFFNETPAFSTYIGATIIIAATIYITNRERLAKN